MVAIPALPLLAAVGMGEQGSALAACWPRAFGFRRVYSPNPSVTVSLVIILVIVEEGMHVKPGDESECIPVLSFAHLTEV